MHGLRSCVGRTGRAALPLWLYQRARQHPAPEGTHRCRECVNKPMFTMRLGTAMQGTHLKDRDWAIGIYLYTSTVKGISFMHLHSNKMLPCLCTRWC